MGSHFSSWIIDLASPGQLKLMQRTTGKRLSEAGAAFKFGPSERADFFVPHGWQPKEVKGLLETAVHFKRTPSEMLAWLPGDRKSTRLNSSHTVISYAVFCLKKKKNYVTCFD